MNLIFIIKDLIIRPLSKLNSEKLNFMDKYLNKIKLATLG